MRELRLFLPPIMVRIAQARLPLVSEESSLQQLSAGGDADCRRRHDWLYTACCNEWGTLPVPEGKAQPLLILGMGKLGGGEPNFFVGHDLIFCPA